MECPKKNFLEIKKVFFDKKFTATLGTCTEDAAAGEWCGRQRTDLGGDAGGGLDLGGDAGGGGLDLGGGGTVVMLPVGLADILPVEPEVTKGGRYRLLAEPAARRMIKNINVALIKDAIKL